jgi:hypothetical protein
MPDTQQARDAHLDYLLWSIIDGEARPWAHRQAMRLLGSRAVRDAELTKRAALDQALLEWGAAPFTSTATAPAAADYGARAPVWRRLYAYPLQYMVAPAAMLGLAVMAAALRFGLHGLYVIVANLVERLP